MSDLVHSDDWQFLRQYTPARLALGRSGHSLPTRALLEFNLDHARARDAIYATFDKEELALQLSGHGYQTLLLSSQATDRHEYLLRPDLGRQLSEESKKVLEELPASPCTLSIVIADGLSATAVNTHALEVVKQLVDVLNNDEWKLAPVCLVEQGRVAIADEIGYLLKAEMVLILIGERPGLSSPDSLGAYLTYAPRPGLTDESRNCVSNIRPEGLHYRAAAQKLHYLLSEMKRHQLSGVGLKDEMDDSALLLMRE
ncbi:ethanolamine ammonia-lyase subunit EutC [Telluribacter sp. SYSU D00476]|uniref:ethanolamine ammonia-lyase subunit EutC n=1 Tax=Telluribacter sp. SYSU D00476 TaxID=2811430 RepID=UPI001FF2083C|nr:ethanolamine ammonia-lyase subunit EutC [Telluribacter sp. SYSU D00476]